MRIVVVGASGALGAALLHRLHREQSRVSIIAVSRHAPVDTGGASWRLIDAGAPGAALASAFVGADAVVHLAWSTAGSNLAGVANVLAAVTASGVRHLVFASSIAAYVADPRRRRVDESWPIGGVAGSAFSAEKASAEHLVDSFAIEHSDVAVSVVRSGFLFGGSGAGRTLLDRTLAQRDTARRRTVVAVQAVHVDDVADAYWRILDGRVAGAFNLAAEPVLDTRSVSAATRNAHRDRGWAAIGTTSPLVSSDRARYRLGWQPRVAASEWAAAPSATAQLQSHSRAGSR
jgi:nucleoside-diphosphate-sugar epimerase